MPFLALLFGALIGLSLGLTGGGGAIFAVPLLVYALAVPTKEAIAVSLAAVGATSLFGFVRQWRAGQVELRTGLLFAFAGMAGAPIGTRLAKLLPDALLMTLFAGLMIIVAARLWQQATGSTKHADPLCVTDDRDAPTCRRSADGTLLLSSRCAILLLVVGVITGILAGTFGVGGGFVIVPALVVFSGMSIHKAVGTSLMVIALISASGVASKYWAGQHIPLATTLLFTLGGFAGLTLGQAIGRRLPAHALQKGFVVAILCVAAFVLAKNLLA